MKSSNREIVKSSNIKMNKKAYITPEADVYTLHTAQPLMAGSPIGSSVSDDPAIGDDPIENLAPSMPGMPDFGPDLPGIPGLPF